MDALRALQTNPPRTTSTKEAGKQASKKSGNAKGRIIQKPQKSDEEIRQKIAEKKEGQNPAVKMEIKKKEFQSSSMIDDPEEIKRRGEAAKEALLKSKEEAKNLEAQDLQDGAPKRNDISKNDPNDPATVGKLKDILSRGGFKFSDKEKATLSKIIE